MPKGPKKKGGLDGFVPYRDSILTWLLKDSLGGNSKTAMIAAISPADYDETLSTLRYADQAKKIQNKAVINEDPNAKLIRQLKEELEMLRLRAGIVPGTKVAPAPGGGGVAPGEAAASLPGADGLVQETLDPSLPPSEQIIHYQTTSGVVKTVTKAELEEQMEENEKLVGSLQESWEQKIKRTEQIHREREQALEAMGITIDKANIGVHTPRFLPHLVNLNEDPLMSECLIYQIKGGTTVVCRAEEEPNQAWANEEHDWGHIRLSGTRILPRHCLITNHAGKVFIEAVDNSLTMVNGRQLAPDEKRRLHSGFRVILGDTHVFRFNHPEEARRARGRMSTVIHQSPDPGSTSGTGTPATPGTSAGRASTAATSMAPASGEEIKSPLPTSSDDVDDQDWDWTAARREAALAALKGEHISFEKFHEHELERLFDDVQKAHLSKRLGGGGTPSTTSSPAPPKARPPLPDLEEWGNEWDGVPGLGLGVATASPSTTEEEVARTPATIPDGHEPASLPDLAREAYLLKEKVKEYEAQLQPASTSHGSSRTVPLGLPSLTARERELGRKYVAQWRRVHGFRMAEAVLQNVVLLKQANVLAHQLRADCVYQFTIVGKDAARESKYTPSSSIAGLDGLEEMDDPALAAADKPCVGVKVLDYMAVQVRIWSLAKLQERVTRMRSLVAVTSNPGVLGFFSLPHEEAGGYTYVGCAGLSLLTVLKQVKQTKFDRVPVYNPHEQQISGYLSAHLQFVALDPPSEPEPREDESLVGSRLSFSLSIGNLCGFNTDHYVAVHLQVRHPVADQFASGPNVSNGDGKRLQRAPLVWIPSSTKPGHGVTASTPVELTSRAKWKEVHLRKTFVLVLTPDVLACLRHELFEIEVHARLTPEYLDQVEAYDFSRTTLARPLPPPAREEAERVLVPNSSEGLLPPQPDGWAFEPELMLPGTDTDPAASSRQPENEMRLDEHHDLLASVQLHEVADGGYQPVPVLSGGVTHTDPAYVTTRPGLSVEGEVPARVSVPSLDGNVFLLRQGLQRKLSLRLRSESGRQFGWLGLRSLEVGMVRCLDGSRVSTSEEVGADLTSFPLVGFGPGPKSQSFIPLPVPPAQQSLAFLDDGTSELTAWAWWDSSVHESTLLAAVSGDRRILLRMRVWIDVPGTEMDRASSYRMSPSPQGVALEVDLPLAIQRREPQTLLSKLRGRFLPPPLPPAERRSNFLLSLVVRPSLTTKRQELWRVDTANTYVRGQEGIAGRWRPRRLSLLREYYDAQALAARRAEVAAVRAWLTADALKPRAPHRHPPHSAHEAEAQLETQSDVVSYWTQLVARRRAKVAFTHEATTVRSAAQAAKRAMSAPLMPQEEETVLRPAPVAGRSKALGDRLAAATGETASTDQIKVVNVTTVGGNDLPVAPLGHRLPPGSGYWSGFLGVLSPTEEGVTPRFAVLRRPYLFLHQVVEGSQGGLDVVLGLSTVRAVHEPHTELLLGRENVFTLYTPANSWLLQAESRQALEGWMYV